jgi:hypothetical protein
LGIKGDNRIGHLFVWSSGHLIPGHLDIDHLVIAVSRCRVAGHLTADRLVLGHFAPSSQLAGSQRAPQLDLQRGASK